MKFTRRYNDNAVNGVRLGLTLKDSVLLRKETDHKHKIQTFTFDDEEEPEQRQYFCASCKSRLDYHKYLDIWICSECYQQYDSKIQDRHIKVKPEFKLNSYHNPH